MLLTSVLSSISRALKMKPKVVFVLGGPGAGKGTQCKKIVHAYGYVHLSAGELLREERGKPNSEHGELINNYIKDGKIVPVEITCKLIENAMKRSRKEKFLIDGFPRNEDNLEGWNKTMSDKVELQFVLFFDCDMKICLERCIKRGEQGSGRVDDNLESLEKRVQTYIMETHPVIIEFENEKLIRRIKAESTEEEIFEEVKKVFDKFNNGSGDK